MVTRSFPFRIFALVAAYALALQALLLNMTPPAAFAGSAPLSLTVICTSATGADQPAGQDHPPCAPDCLMAACGYSGLAPPDTAVVANIALAEFRILGFAPIEIRGRAFAKTPQIPRAPPLV
jgi:hypothetical protein